MAHLPAFLFREDLQLILFSGKGGVGKTTCAVASAVHMALGAPKFRFLLVSVDPAHSVRDCLGEDTPPQNLDVIELDAPALLREFLTAHEATLREIARRSTFFDEADIAHFAARSLPGMDELFAFLRIAEWVQKGAYQTILVDTAPAGHTRRLLEMPQLLRAWTKACDGLLAKHRYMVQQFRGAYKSDATDQLLVDLAQFAKQVDALLRSAASLVVPVLVPEPLCLEISLNFVNELRAQGIKLGPLVINRLRNAEGCASCALVALAQKQALAARQTQLADDGGGWGLPLLAKEVRGLEHLRNFWQQGEPYSFIAPPVSTKLPNSISSPRIDIEIEVQNPAALPPQTQRVLLFAGKGGVGKTTLACATALFLSATAQRSVLLISTDPAHSLSAALNVAISATDTRLPTWPRLTVVAPEPQAKWQAWRDEYADEISAFFRKRLGHVDLAFDRQALEQLMDLTPPGLDEIVSLTRVGELLAENKYEHIVLDTAPTGHLLRLLELPAVLDDWLKGIFAILLKQQPALRLPRLSDRLIGLSKQLKRLRKVLWDAQQSSLYAVSIATCLAHEETLDLLHACRRLSLHVGGVFVNQCTPVANCKLCTALFQRETQVNTALQREVANVPLTCITAGTPPLGLAALFALGQKLYTLGDSLGR